MHLFTTLLMACAFSSVLTAQVTIVRAYPSDTFDISCHSCTVEVSDVALTRGQQSIPINLSKPVAKNLFYWRYFDDISKEQVITTDEPVWAEQRHQLIDEVDAAEMLSLHINLTMRDSTTRTYKINLVLSGISKNMLNDLPLETTFDQDTYMGQRFSAIAQIIPEEGGPRDTYDCMEGGCTLETFEPKKIKLGGAFEFKGNKVGVEKRGFFVNGTFER